MPDTQTIIVQQIPLRLIKPNPNNRLITQEAIDAMAESINTIGLKNAIKVRPLGDGTFEVFSGHIRRAGAIKLGWETIACIVSDKTLEEDVLEGIWDNRQQAQTWLDDYEDIEALLRVNPDYTNEQLGKKLDMSDRSIKRGKRLLKCLNPASRALINQNLSKTLILRGQTLPTSTPKWELTEDPVYRLTDLEDPETVFKALQVVIDQQLTGPKATALADHLKAGQPVEAFNPHQSVAKTAKVSTPAPLPAELADKVVELPVPVHHTHPAHLSPQGGLSPSGDSTPAPAAAPISHNPSQSAVSKKVYMFRDWAAGVKVIPQLKHKVEKGETLTFAEAMVLGGYRLGEGGHWLWKEMIKPSLKTFLEKFKKTFGKTIYYICIALVLAFLIWKAWPVIQIALHPIRWIESKFQHEQPAPVETTQPVTSTILPPIQAVIPKAPEKKAEKPAMAPQTLISLGLGQPKRVARHEASQQVYQPAVSFNTTVSPSNTSGTLYDPKLLETEIAALPQNSFVEDYPLVPDETMSLNLAVGRMQDLTDPDKYTMKIGHGTEKILSVNPTTTNLTVAYKSTDALGGLIDGSGQMNFFWEDVKAIHANAIDLENQTPSAIYQCSLIVLGAKNPLTIQCASKDDLEHLVSTMEYFIRNSRLGRDTALGGIPYPDQGMNLNNGREVTAVWANSPVDQGGVECGDFIWSTGKNTDGPQEKKKIEAALAVPGQLILYRVPAAVWKKRQNGSVGFNPARLKVVLTAP